MRFYLILISIFLTLFKFIESPLTLSFGDFISFLIGIIFVHDLLTKNLKINDFSKWWLYYILLLFVSALFNFTLFEGRFLNIFKTNLFSLIFFIITYKLVYTNNISIKNYVISIFILGVIFLLKTWPEMQKTWANSDNNFTSLDIFESSLNLNSWGFILILFLVVLLYCWISRIFTLVSSICCVILVAFVYFSFSRTAYSLTAVVLLWSIFYINKTDTKNLIILALVTAVFLFLNIFDIINFNVSESAHEFFEKKTNRFGDDLAETRFYEINVKPLLEFYDSFNLLQIGIGDGLSTQHSFISHNLIIGGILGFFIFLNRVIKAFKYCINQIKNNSNVKESKFIILVVSIILTNDFITNASCYTPFIAYLSSIILAFLFAVIDSKNFNSNTFNKFSEISRIEKEYNIPNRI